jgi:predicted permease
MLIAIGIYFFIFIGFLSKKIFKDDINEKTLVLLSVYFLQPFLTFWGLMIKDIDSNLLLAPSLYLLIVFATLIVTFFIAKSFRDKEERSIVAVTALVGNTGNLGIPLSLALFGEIGVLYTTMINLANIFFIYTVAIFFYANGNYSFKESFLKIIKIPIIWVGIIAIILNINGVKLDENIMQILQMGAFTSMVVQLLIFGIYLGKLKFEYFNFKLTGVIVLIKFGIFPLIGYLISSSLNIDKIVFQTVLFEIMMPIAVTNVNLVALFGNKAVEVAMLIVVTSLLFIFVVPFI